MKFFPEKNTIKKIAPYALGTLAVGAVVGLSYFGFTYQIPVSAFTDAQLATAANLGTYGTAIVGSGAKIASFTAAQFAIATGYGAVVAAALSGSVFGAFKAAQFAVQQCAKCLNQTKKNPDLSQPQISKEAKVIADKNLPQEMADPGVGVQRSCDNLMEASTKYAALMAHSRSAVAVEAADFDPVAAAAPVILTRPDSPSKRLPSADFNQNNIIEGNRARTPSQLYNAS